MRRENPNPAVPPRSDLAPLDNTAASPQTQSPFAIFVIFCSKIRLCVLLLNGVIRLDLEERLTGDSSMASASHSFPPQIDNPAILSLIGKTPLLEIHRFDRKSRGL